MNRRLRIVALLIALIGAWPVCHAQQTQTVTFAYDLNGNRITKEILFGKQERNGETSEEFHSSATDSFETMEVSLYPNPTNDKFFVEIKSDTSEKAEATLTHISGAVLEKRILVNSLESFDLSGHAVGVYLLRLEVGKETHIWKVIKK